METDKKSINGYLCKGCGSDSLERVFDENKQKYYAVCIECGSTEFIPTCSHCDSSNLSYDEKRAELSCKDCGLVLDCPVHYVGGDILVVPGWQ